LSKHGFLVEPTVLEGGVQYQPTKYLALSKPSESWISEIAVQITHPRGASDQGFYLWIETALRDRGSKGPWGHDVSGRTRSVAKDFISTLMREISQAEQAGK
jgi:hypothetical protein